jgi:hypothetical protein
MTLIPISQKEFKQGVNNSQLYSPYATERAWFEHKAMFGTVLLDKIDNDWSYVALGRDENGIFRAFHVGTSYLTKIDAHNALEKILKDHENMTVFPKKMGNDFIDNLFEQLKNLNTR